MDGNIYYKLRFTDEWLLLPQRRDKLITTKDIEQLPNLYSKRLKIKNRKFQDLQDLKTTLPSDYHYFYDYIPIATFKQ